jgi:methyltransferase (TIGR00027 family)
MPSVIETARWAAAQRARESERPDHLFFDPLARALAGEEGMAALQLSERYNPSHEDTARYISIRIRCFDDAVQHFAAAGIRQIVLLAAGMDARAYRCAWPDGTTLYEVDHPELLAVKEEILQRQGHVPRCRRITLGMNLEHDWACPIVDAGFLPGERSVWLIEGLFYYLEEPAVNHVLAEVSRLASPGSTLLTDLVSHSLLTSPWMQDALKAMQERGIGWRFGADDPAGLFGRYGWQAEVKSPDEEALKYDPKRFCTSPSGRPAISGSYFVFAHRTS